MIRDWPHRPHHGVGAVGGMVAVILALLAPPRAASATHLLDPQVGWYFAVSCGAIGIVFVVIGLLDHQLLVQAMWRPPSAAGDRLPPDRLATTRTVLAGSVAVTLLIHFALLGWPWHGWIVTSLFYLLLLVVTIAGAAPDLRYGLRAFNEAAREREASLLARVRGGNAAPVVPTPMSEIPRPDLWGHLVLPVVMAIGALVDIALREKGFPSLLALGLAGSQLRIAIRDWPSRKHYLLTAIAAAIGAVQHAFIGTVSGLDWAVSFLMLMSASMLVVGLCDRRLEPHARNFSDGRHAHTV